jgi:hypothetical protein
MKEKRPPRQQSGFFLSDISRVYGGHSLTDISTISDGRFPSFSHALPRYITRRRGNDPHDNSRHPSFLQEQTQSHSRSIDRLKVNPLHIWSNDIKNDLCSAGMSINSRSGKSRALDISYFLAQVMPKFRHDLC